MSRSERRPYLSQKALENERHCFPETLRLQELKRVLLAFKLAVYHFVGHSLATGYKLCVVDVGGEGAEEYKERTTTTQPMKTILLLIFLRQVSAKEYSILCPCCCWSAL